MVTSEPSVISALSRLWKTALTLAKSLFLASFSIIEASVMTSSIVMPSSCARSSYPVRYAASICVSRRLMMVSALELV